MIAGISASAGALVSNTDAGDTYSFHNTFVGRQNPQIQFSTNQSYQQPVNVKQTRWLGFTTDSWIENHQGVTYQRVPMEVPTNCGSIIAPGYIPIPVDIPVKHKITHWDPRDGILGSIGRGIEHNIHGVGRMFGKIIPKSDCRQEYISVPCPQQICPDINPCLTESQPSACEQAIIPNYSTPTPAPPRPTPVNPGYQTMPGPNYAPTGNISPRGF